MTAVVLIRIEKQENGIVKIKYQIGEEPHRVACPHEKATASEITAAIKVFICENGNQNITHKGDLHVH